MGPHGGEFGGVLAERHELLLHPEGLSQPRKPRPRARALDHHHAARLDVNVVERQPKGMQAVGAAAHVHVV